VEVFGKVNIKEIDGKKFVEYNEYEQVRRRKRETISILFLILIAIAIIAIIFAITTLIKNKNIIQSDPLRYGMDVHGFISCQCFDEQGRDWYSNGTGFVHRRQGEGWINYSELIINPDDFIFGDNE